MDILVSHTSALSYWRTVGSAFLKDGRSRRAATRRARVAAASKEKPRLAGGGRRPAGCTLPLEVLVGDRDARTTTAHVSSSMWGSALPEGSFVDAGEGLLVSTPEFCFLQMAGRLTLVQLVLLGCELCGTYVLADQGPAYRRDAPLTSASKLRSFAERACGAYGRKAALRAARYVLDGSASPMETVLALLLSLPNNLGGYGICRPKLNHSVDIPRSLRKVADRSYCECDLCWPDRGLCLEYDSRLYHTDPERQESDARRRSTLASLGLTVVTVSRGQVMDSAALNRLAHQVAKLTGKRLRYKDPQFTRAHLALREELFDALGLVGHEYLPCCTGDGS